jgi:hypothetical protein
MSINLSIALRLTVRYDGAQLKPYADKARAGDVYGTAMDVEKMTVLFYRLRKGEDGVRAYQELVTIDLKTRVWNGSSGLCRTCSNSVFFFTFFFHIYPSSLTC